VTPTGPDDTGSEDARGDDAAEAAQDDGWFERWQSEFDREWDDYNGRPTREQREEETRRRAEREAQRKESERVLRRERGFLNGDLHTSRSVPAWCIDVMDDREDAVCTMRTATSRMVHWNAAVASSFHAIRALGAGRHYLDARSTVDDWGTPEQILAGVRPNLPFASLIGVSVEPSEKDTAFKPPGSPTFRHHVNGLAEATFHVDSGVRDGHVRVHQEPGYSGPTLFLSRNTLAALWDNGLWIRIREHMWLRSEGTHVVPRVLLAVDSVEDIERALLGVGPSREDTCAFPGCLQDSVYTVDVGEGDTRVCRLHGAPFTPISELHADPDGVGD
jgi:hypothetical protein